MTTETITMLQDLNAELVRLRDERDGAETMDQADHYASLAWNVEDSTNDLLEERDEARKEREEQLRETYFERLKANGAATRDVRVMPRILATLHASLEEAPSLKALVVSPTKTKVHKMFIMGTWVSVLDGANRPHDYAADVYEVLKFAGMKGVTMVAMGDQNSGAIGFDAETYFDAGHAMSVAARHLRDVTGLPITIK